MNDHSRLAMLSKLKWECLKVLIFNVGTLGYIIISPPILLKNTVIVIILYALALWQTFFVGMKIRATDEVERLPVIMKTFIYSTAVLLVIYLLLGVLFHYQILLNITSVVFYIIANVVGAVLIMGSAMTLGTALSLIVKLK
jgi:hypothetical protein